jgi:hypothetical protein
MTLTEKSTALEKEISSTRDAIREKTFWKFTKLSHEDQNHPLRKHESCVSNINCLPFLTPFKNSDFSVKTPLSVYLQNNP